MTQGTAIDVPVTKICRAIRDAAETTKLGPGIGRLEECLCFDEPGMIDPTLAFASAKSCLSLRARRAHRVPRERDTP